jgi:hypothetical protein
VAVAVSVAALAHAHGGYEASGWAPAGVVLVLAAGTLLALGRRPSALVAVAAGLFVCLGGWAVLSTAWGGLPHQAWRFLDQALIAALAVLVGSLVAPDRRGRTAIGAGVLAGIAVCAGDLVLRPLPGSAPEEWFDGRTLQGWIGYHNAQASFLAIGVALALWGLGSRGAAVRAVSGGAAALCLAGVLLTQSRAGLGMTAITTVLVLAWSRDAGLFLRAVPLALAGAALSKPLRDVDRALVEGRAGLEDALESYAVWAIVATLVVAGCAIPVIRWARVRRGLTIGVAAVALVALSGAAVRELRSPSPFGGALSTFNQADPNVAAAGSTRLASFSFNGRRDAWRVAWSVARDAPVAGAGQGTYPRAWTEERRLGQLYILQPHSLFLELFAELGLVGLALFAGAVGLIVLSVARSRDRLFAAAALGALFALVAQAAVDWTWSFPGLVVPALLVAGAAVGGARSRPPSVVATVAGALLVLVAVGLLGAHWMGRRELDRARDVPATDPAAARSLVASSRSWNRWDPEPLELRGRIAESEGAYAAAIADYDAAADLSQMPWLDHLRVARAARAAGNVRRRASACALAHRENPAETRLRDAIC